MFGSYVRDPDWPNHVLSVTTIMGPDVIRAIPWGIILLFGGGFALASGFQKTGLSAYIGQSFVGVGGLHPIIMVFILCAGMTFLTEVTSNTATASLLLPVLGALAEALQVSPMILMVTAALCASFAFMLPVATAPNAIVFGSERVPIKSMIKQGFKLNLIGALIIATVATWWL